MWLKPNIQFLLPLTLPCLFNYQLGHLTFPDSELTSYNMDALRIWKDCLEVGTISSEGL